jgi:hypothetical protein
MVQLREEVVQSQQKTAAHYLQFVIKNVKQE